MSGSAGEIQVLVLLVTVLRAEIANLHEVVTEPERGSLFEIEAFFPRFGLVHDLELDVFLQIGRAHLFGETVEDSFASAVNQRVPILFGAGIEMTNRNQNV